MSKKTESTSKTCGNCRYHNAYEYPDKVFCFSKFSEKKNPVVSIYGSCDEWENKLQDCLCLGDALAKRLRKTRTKKKR